MSDDILVALLGLLGTFLGSLFGIMTSSKLTQYRIQKLEEKVNKHNNLIERMYAVEKHEEVVDVEMESVNRRLGKLEKFHAGG